MKVLEFCERYNNTTDQLKCSFINENLKIKPYISIIEKDGYAQAILNKSMYDQEEYTDEEGNKKFRKTDRIKVNSVVQYVQFCRFIITNYTNLENEDGSFIKDYDALKSSGLLDILIIGDENTPPLIPVNEIAEFRSILDMKAKDILTNEYEPHAFISNQIERFAMLSNVTLNPIIEAVGEKIGDMPKETVDKTIDFAKNGGFKEV